MYAFLVEKAQDRVGLSDDEAARIMVEESRAYDGPWNSIRADLEAGAHANYTWFTKHIVPAPWNREPGRHHRRRRAQLPSHDRAGCRAGARGRPRADRAARRARRARRRAVGRVPRPPHPARDRPSSRRPCSSGSGRSTATATRTPPV